MLFVVNTWCATLLDELALAGTFEHVFKSVSRAEEKAEFYLRNYRASRAVINILCEKMCLIQGQNSDKEHFLGNRREI